MSFGACYETDSSHVGLMEKLEIEKSNAPVNTVKNGFYISTKLAIVICISLVAIFVGSILATYFGKNCNTGELKDKCLDLVCSETNLISQWTETCITGKTTMVPTTPTPERVEYRLPTDLSPYLYDLTIQPYFKPTQMPETYDASIKIHFTCLNDTNKLVLHMNNQDLTINNSTLSLSSSTDASFTSLNNFQWSYDNITNFFKVVLTGGRMFRANNNYTFSASFGGKIQANNVGFYRTSYLYTENGITSQKWVLASLTCFVEARNAFMCFDEPAFKAIFKIRIRHDSSMTAMANTPVQTRTNLGASAGYDWVETEFYETVKMSTYLLAILVSDFECKAGVANTPLSGGVNVSVCARSSASNELNLALNSSIEALEFFEDFYKFKYPLPKLDHVGLKDFRFGAMENWGLVGYRESNLIYNDANPQTNELNVVATVSHEISHMWFGNLVTPKWWDDLWLNEGFARFMEHLGADHIKPEWRMFDNLFDLILGVMQSDSRDTIRPIWLETNTVDDINNNYDGTITYGKGSAVVKMLTYVLGEETFRNGIRSYFQKFQFSNVDQYDLWDSLYEQAVIEGKLEGIDIANVMTTWTKQKGHPVVTIKILNSTHVDCMIGELLKSLKWHIPFSHSVETVGSTNSFTNQVTTYNLFDRIVFLDPSKSEETIKLEKPLGVNDFVLGNLDVSGYYRVNYDDNNWRLITRQIIDHKNELSPRTRAQLINDLFSFAQANYLDNSLAFDFSKYLSNELDYLPWKTFLMKIRYFINVLESTPSYGNLQAFLASLVQPYYQKLGWIENIHTDEWNDRNLRKKIVSFSCDRDVLDCVNTARTYFDSWSSDLDIQKIPSNLRSAVMCTSIRRGTAKDFDLVFNQAQNTSVLAVKNDLLEGLSCSNEQWQLIKYLTSQYEDNLLLAVYNVATRPNGYLLAWYFLKSNWDFIYDKYQYSSLLPSTITELAGKFRLEENLKDFDEFFSGKHLNNDVDNAVTDSVILIKSNINWFNKNWFTILAWLDNNSPTRQ